MKYSVEVNGETTILRLDGAINEDTEETFDTILEQVRTKAVVIDCTGIGMMNSLGTASWTMFVRRLDAKASVELRDVPSIMVHFAGMLAGVFGQGRVVSFRAPFFCPACKAPATVAIATASLAGGAPLPAQPCPKCGASMRCEVDLEGYSETLHPNAAPAADA